MTTKEIKVHVWDLIFLRHSSIIDDRRGTMAIEIVGEGYFNPTTMRIDKTYDCCWFRYAKLPAVIQTLRSAKLCACGRFVF